MKAYLRPRLSGFHEQVLFGPSYRCTNTDDKAKVKPLKVQGHHAQTQGYVTDNI